VALCDTLITCASCGDRLAEDQARSASWRLLNDDNDIQPTCWGCDSTESPSDVRDAGRGSPDGEARSRERGPDGGIQSLMALMLALTLLSTGLLTHAVATAGDQPLSRPKVKTNDGVAENALVEARRRSFRRSERSRTQGNTVRRRKLAIPAKAFASSGGRLPAS
jgi:hypothetical protein